MSPDQLSSFLASLEPGMQLFVPRAWAEREIAAKTRRDAEMASLAFASGCELLMRPVAERERETGYLFAKRPR